MSSRGNVTQGAQTGRVWAVVPSLVQGSQSAIRRSIASVGPEHRNYPWLVQAWIELTKVRDVFLERAGLRKPLDLRSLEGRFELPDYICLEPAHDEIINLSACEYILGCAYEEWEAKGEPGVKHRLAAAPAPWGPVYANLTPILEALRQIGNSPVRVKPLAPGEHPHWSLRHDGWFAHRGANRTKPVKHHADCHARLVLGEATTNTNS